MTMACEVEQQAVNDIQALLDDLLSQYDQLVWTIAGVTGQLQAAQMALAMCQQQGPPTAESMTGSDIQQIQIRMHECSQEIRDWMNE